MLRTLLLNASIRDLTGAKILAVDGNDAVGLWAEVGSKTLEVEHDIHVLEWETLGLREEAPCKDHTADERAAEEKESAVGDVVHHVRGGVHNDELTEPLGAGGEDKADWTDTGGEDLSAKKKQGMLVW